MITVTIVVDAPSWAAQGIKEHLAMVLEPFGDTRVVDVSITDAPVPMEQTLISDYAR